MSAQLPDDERRQDLLAKRATEGLTDDEARELESLSASAGDSPDDTFDRIVAELSAAARPAHRMPDAVRARILSSVPRARPARFGGRSGWWAAAACLVLAVAGWWPRLVSSPGVEPAARTLAQARDELLARPGVVQVSLAPAAAEPATTPLTGDVVFDPVSQRGYLRFRGIPANDPRLAQYQLWIADSSRSRPEPVDGGVFDVTQDANTGDVLIPFEAKLRVGTAAAFVVTLEHAGGVVVSRQERVLALGRTGA